MLQKTTPNREAYGPTKVTVQITPELIIGDFDLQSTVQSGQTGMPEWLNSQSGFTDLVGTEKGFLRFHLRQIHGPSAPRLQLTLERPLALNGMNFRAAQELIMSALDLRRDLRTFYREFDNDPLSDAFERFPGLRLMQGWNEFEALTSCLLTQFSSVKGWNTVARRLRAKFGLPVTFSDGSTIYGAPPPEKLSNAAIDELRSCGTGFRAKYLKEAARLVAEGELDLQGIRRMEYPKAKDHLMEIPGIGPKVADCLLLYGFGMMQAAPVDVWMSRVVRSLYLRGRRVTPKRTAEFLQRRFDGWAGYAQLYLYHYARSLRVR